jgi:hypothetical protein
MQQQGLDYQYGGQWFDDMGALAMTFQQSPTLGVELANSNLPRVHTDSMASAMFGSQLNPYDWGDQGVQ